MKEYYLKKDDKKIGKVKVDLKKMLLIAGLAFTVTNLTGCGSKEPEIAISSEYDFSNSNYLDTQIVGLMNDAKKLYGDEKVKAIKNIEQIAVPNLESDRIITVSIGDYEPSLSGFITKYIDDNPNNKYEIITKMQSIQSNFNPENIKENIKYSVPYIKEEYMEKFGYTMDYSKLPIETEIIDRLDFLKEHKKLCTLLILSETTGYDLKYKSNDILEQIVELEIKFNTSGEEEYENILDEARYICEYVKKELSNDFENYKKPHEINGKEKSL